MTEKKGYWYVILNLYDDGGKRKQKWLSTGLRSKGNRQLAEEKLFEYRLQYTQMETIRYNSKDLFFHDYMLLWLQHMEKKLAPSTYSNYVYTVKNRIVPYFREQNILLFKLEPADIEKYYAHLYSIGLSSNTVYHHHINIHKALTTAVLKKLIFANPSDNMERPKKDKFITTPYNLEEANQLLNVIKGDELELVIALTLFYGLRRGEVLGLRWRAIDFTYNTICICHTIEPAVCDGKYTLVPRDKVKRKSSYRTLPLVDSIKIRLLEAIRKRYSTATPPPDDYICINTNDTLFRPDYVTKRFKKLLLQHQLRSIRFHDLRHSCASILIANRTPLIEVQQWMGHSNFATTADLYTHLDYTIKERSANTLKKIKTVMEQYCKKLYKFRRKKLCLSTIER